MCPSKVLKGSILSPIHGLTRKEKDLEGNRIVGMTRRVWIPDDVGMPEEVVRPAEAEYRWWEDIWWTKWCIDEGTVVSELQLSADYVMIWLLLRCRDVCFPREGRENMPLRKMTRH
ncbi:hypothetical protein FOYG_00438 [Fusarium oxysporum NRRL 32931]|uniref:Uncharacterized protein n=1 Tax=Fusarium oxysporum NRRL 32931 TaxID=660029 RepID=W9J031_FUSOX|nr:hypothetical protein FOYG_00438 [Fusarium oxysporum NRRL 32931]